MLRPPQNLPCGFRSLLTALTGLLLTAAALSWWGFRWLHHPSRLLITSDGFGGTPCVCWLPPRRNNAVILLPGNPYAAGRMLRTLEQNGENRIRVIFAPAVNRQLRSLERFQKTLPTGHIILMPLPRNRSSWRSWLEKAPYEGWFIQVATTPIVNWKLDFGRTEYKEPFWSCQTGRISFYLCEKRSGDLQLILKLDGKNILEREISRSSRPETFSLPLPEEAAAAAAGCPL